MNGWEWREQLEKGGAPERFPWAWSIPLKKRPRLCKKG